METQVETLQAELENSEDARAILKDDLGDANDRLIKLEEELFESKTIQLELMENLTDAETKLNALGEEYEDKLVYGR